jgi:hypothetical protein
MRPMWDCRESFVTQLHKAYVSLAIGANNNDSLRTASIRRFGTLEVLLVEFAPSQKRDTLDIWIEVYDHVEAPQPRSLCFRAWSAPPKQSAGLGAATRLHASQEPGRIVA